MPRTKAPIPPMPADPTAEQLDLILPSAGTVPARVIQWFADNPDEELYAADIAIRFDTARESIATALRRAVDAGLLACEKPTRHNTPGGAIYRAGPLCVQGAERLRQAITARCKVSRQVLPEIDLTTLQVERGVPIAPPYAAKGRTRYDAMFDLLTEPGLSTALPFGYKGSVEKAALLYTKRTGRRLRVVRESIDRIRVHRVADKEASA